MRELALAVTLALFAAVVLAGTASARSTQTVQAESMTPSGSVGAVRADKAASGGQFYYLWSNGYIYKDLTLSGTANKLTVRVKGDYCGGWPHMAVKVDGAQVYADSVSSSTWRAVPIAVNLASGIHRLEIHYTNDYQTQGCDRNLGLDRVYFNVTGSREPTPAPPPPRAGANPFEGETLYIKDYNPARTTANQWYAQGRTADAQQMEKIAQTPTAAWFTSSANGVGDYVGKAAQKGQLPVLVLYAIPHRDCGSYSAGGLSPTNYRNFIDQTTAAIGTRKAVVILEPDALLGINCLSSALQQERYDLLNYAVSKLKSNPSTHVYIDIGHPWNSDAAAAANKLNKAGIARADGFSTNVSGFRTAAEETAWCNRVSALTGGAHCVIDTSRSGKGYYMGGTHDGDCPDWANPPGRALGPKPSPNTGSPVVDSYLWIKYPGESDGDCGGFPPAGHWVPEYALQLAKNA